MSGKGSKRRPGDEDALARNWPFPPKKAPAPDFRAGGLLPPDTDYTGADLHPDDAAAHAAFMSVDHPRRPQRDTVAENETPIPETAATETRE